MKASELNLQGTCYQWAYNTHQEVRGLLHHIPNGGKRSIVEAAQLKASGVVWEFAIYFYLWREGTRMVCI